MPLPPLPDPSDRSRRLAGLVRATPALAFLSSSLLAINLLQAMSTVLLPLSRRAFRSVNRKFTDLWGGWTVRSAEWAHGTRVTITGDDVPVDENAILVVNHQQMADITFLLFWAREKGRIGDIKFFVKDVLKYVPAVGWGMLFLDYPFVKRDWTADRDSITSTFRRILRDQVPYWLVTFAEGTRVTPGKIRESQEYARSRGLPLLRHVLVPRTKGFVASVQGLRDTLDAVYDVTLGYENGVPDLWQYIKGFSTMAHLHIRRFPAAALPAQDGDLAAWLMERYREKDDRLEVFYRSGSFRPARPGPGQGAS